MQHNFQFLQIQAVLQSTGEEGHDDLVKLRDDLVELIHVSEGTKCQLILQRILLQVMKYICLNLNSINRSGFEPEREVATLSHFSDNLSLKIWRLRQNCLPP